MGQDSFQHFQAITCREMYGSVPLPITNVDTSTVKQEHSGCFWISNFAGNVKKRLAKIIFCMDIELKFFKMSNHIGVFCFGSCKYA